MGKLNNGTLTYNQDRLQNDYLNFDELLCKVLSSVQYFIICYVIAKKTHLTCDYSVRSSAALTNYFTLLFIHDKC